MPNVGPTTEPYLQRVARRLVSSPLFWVVFLLFAGGWQIVRSILATVPPALPTLGVVPEFTLTNQYGQDFGSQELAGQVWIANFIFTRCPTVCPAFTQTMFDIQHKARPLSGALRLVSFSVDPEHDTPKVLLEYARANKASRYMWAFLTGHYEAIRTTVVDGLKVAMGRDGPEEDFMSIFHGNYMVLVDQQGQIRGYYDAGEAGVVDRVLRGAGLLINRGH